MRILRNIGAVTVGTFFEKIVSVPRFGLIAAVVSPIEMGIYALFLTLVSVGDALLKMGIDEAVLRENKNYTKALNNLFWVRLVRSLIIIILIYSFSDYVSQFVKERGYNEEISLFLLCITLGYFFRATSSLGLDRLEKEQKFVKLTLFNSSSAVLSLLMMAGALIFKPSLEGVFIGYVFSELLRNLTSYFYFSIIPNFRFYLQHFTDTFNFSAWIAAATLISTISLHVDKYVVAKFLGLEQLGLYYLIVQLVSSLFIGIGKPVSRVLRSYFCSIQDKLGEMIKTVQIGAIIIALISLFIIIPMHAYGKNLFIFFSAYKWLPALPLLPYAVIWQAIIACTNFCTPIFIAVGNSHPLFRHQVLYTSITCMSLFLFAEQLTAVLVINCFIASASISLLYLYFVIMHYKRI